MLALARKVKFWESCNSDDRPLDTSTETYTGWYKGIQVYFSIQLFDSETYSVYAEYQEVALGEFESRANYSKFYLLANYILNFQNGKRKSVGRSQEKLEKKQIKRSYFQEAKQLAREAMEE